VEKGKWARSHAREIVSKKFLDLRSGMRGGMTEKGKRTQSHVKSSFRNHLLVLRGWFDASTFTFVLILRRSVSWCYSHLEVLS